jgi:two-component system, NtrC family, sensor kinase
LNRPYKFTEALSAPLFVSPTSYPDSTLTIQGLPLIASCVDIHLSVGEVAGLFERHPDWPGVILTARGQFVGLLTRRTCSEFLGTFLGTGIFSKVPIFAFFERHPACGLVLDGGTSVAMAVKAALKREGVSVYDPIVVRQNGCHYSLLDMWVLLEA